MGERFNIFCKRILKEMSVKAKPIRAPYSHYQDKWRAAKFNAEYIEDFSIVGQDFKVYSLTSDQHIQLFFIQDDNIFIYLEFFLEDDDGITILFMWKVGAIGPMMPSLFKKYLLVNFKYVMSDASHTPQGFNVYYDLSKDPAVETSIVYDDRVVILDENDDLTNYYGSEAKHQCRFLVKLK